jgi:16S rRNA (cytosine1402-N4)-methyltransferase
MPVTEKLQYSHISVLLNEVLEHLAIEPDKTYFDGTLGAAGHSKAILEKLNKNGRLISFDQDPAVIQKISSNKQANNWILENKNFQEIWAYCAEKKIEIDGGILLDLGLSSIQLDDPERGFSFHAETTLDMRMDTKLDLDAHDVINTFSEKDIADILYTYGEERKSRVIAKTIMENRPVNTCKELAEIIKRIYVKSSSRKTSFKTHPATKSFQALRIYVNKELEVLENLLKFDFDCLESGARIAIISFHSLEDRIVKNAFRNYKQEGKVKIITKKPLIATEDELEVNARSRSAKLRVCEIQ